MIVRLESGIIPPSFEARNASLEALPRVGEYIDLGPDVWCRVLSVTHHPDRIATQDANGTLVMPPAATVVLG